MLEKSWLLPGDWANLMVSEWARGVRRRRSAKRRI